MADYLPAGEAEFNLWQGNLVRFTEPQLASWSIPARDFSKLKTAQYLLCRSGHSNPKGQAGRYCWLRSLDESRRHRTC